MVEASWLDIGRLVCGALAVWFLAHVFRRVGD